MKIKNLICFSFFLLFLSFAYANNALLAPVITSGTARIGITLGNPKGDITMVEFTDYNCSYCKLLENEINQVIAHDKNLRVVIVEYPVVAPSSLIAAKAAVAADDLGKFSVFHNKLMQHKGVVDEHVINNIAKTVGLDATKLHENSNSKEVKQKLLDNMLLGNSLSIMGTPTLVLAKTITQNNMEKISQQQPLVNFGYVTYSTLISSIEEMRKSTL